MEVFSMDQDQLNSNVMSTYEPSPVSSNSIRPQSMDVCENCQRSIFTVNNNGPPRVISPCVTGTQDCTCRTSSSDVTSLSRDDAGGVENRTGFGDTNNSRPSMSPTVMSLTNSGGVRLPSSTITQDQHLNVGSPACPHLLNSSEGVGVHLSSNLNRQTNFCQACGPTVSNLTENVTLLPQDLFASSSSSPPQSTGPIPIPSRTNRRLRPHHHHHFSSSLSSSPQGLDEDHSVSSSPPGPTIFSSSCSSTGWKFRERASGNTSGYSSSEPGHIPAFFPQQSPKYFKQPSSSQDYAAKYPGSDKPSMIDQWPRSPSRRLSSSSNRSSAQKISSKTSRGELSGSGFASHRRGLTVSRGSGGPSRKTSTSPAVSRNRVGDEEEPLDIGERRLPYELLNQLHELEHQNEDLSADVVFSLEKKGYNIHEILGKGISSTVRRVTEKQTGKEYAVKIIDISGEKCETAVVEQTKRDTFREIRILRMCGGHPNIIELHDVFETPTFIFLVFEICKQGELFDYLTSVVSLSEKKTRFFMRQLLEAVYYCHEKSIVHRDLKPENILLDDDLNIKVSDFGFATVVEPKEELSELCGTPGYLAPEVLAHSMYENVPGYGKEVDMWACGVIMYTLLCGAPPFWNRRQMMMLRAIMNADYSFNSPEWDDISDAPKNLIEKLLVVNPKERLTAKEALEHPFFHSQIQDQKRFNARRKFRAAVFCVLFYTRLNFYFKHPPPIPVKTISTNPYSVKIMRKIIDSCAFGMYRHWVKRVDNQNRAALFEHTLREDWKHGLITNNGSWNNVQSH